MGSPNFTQLKSLPPAVNNHGIRDVYTKDEIHRLLENYTPGEGGTGTGIVTSSILNVVLHKEHGIFDTDTNTINIQDPSFDINDMHMFYIGGILQGEGQEYAIDVINKTISKLDGDWPAGYVYDFMFLNVQDDDGNPGRLKYHSYFGSIVGEQDRISIPILEYNPETDDLLLYIGGLFQTKDIEYYIDEDTMEIVDTQNIWEDGYIYNIVIFKDMLAVMKDVITRQELEFELNALGLDGGLTTNIVNITPTDLTNFNQFFTIKSGSTVLLTTPADGEEYTFNISNVFNTIPTGYTLKVILVSNSKVNITIRDRLNLLVGHSNNYLANNTVILYENSDIELVYAGANKWIMSGTYHINYAGYTPIEQIPR